MLRGTLRKGAFGIAPSTGSYSRPRMSNLELPNTNELEAADCFRRARLFIVSSDCPAVSRQHLSPVERPTLSSALDSCPKLNQRLGFFPLPFAQAHPRPTAILINEFYAGGFQRAPNGQIVCYG